MHKSLFAVLVSILASLFLSACQGQSSSGYQSNSVMPASQNYTQAAKLLNCQSGQLDTSSKLAALNYFNKIRRAHGLQELSYDYASDSMVMSAALVMAANNKLDHNINESWRCYSHAAEQGARLSNIGLYRSSDTSTQAIDFYESQSIKENLVGYMTEINHVNPGSLGHRRWALNPFLKKTAYGQVSDISDGLFISSSAVRVIYDEDDLRRTATVATPQSIIAYPYGNYPAEFFHQNAELSFAVLINEYDYYANVFVDYEKVKISIRQGAKQWSIKPEQIQYDSLKDAQYGFAGLPNHLQFRFPELTYQHLYQVEIQDVKVCAEAYWQAQGQYEFLQCDNWYSKNYRYEFKIIP